VEIAFQHTLNNYVGMSVYELQAVRYCVCYLTYTVKKVSEIPAPSRDVTYQTLPGRGKLNYSRPGRVW
jgi:hypothetical protein